MPLDGLRAWIGEVERKLGMRTRVFLVLSTLAIGGAGAAIYLAIDTRDDAVSESDVRAMQERIEGQIGTGGTTGANLSQLEAELKALEAEVDRLRGAQSGSNGQRGAAAEDTGARPRTPRTEPPMPSRGSWGAPQAGPAPMATARLPVPARNPSCATCSSRPNDRAARPKTPIRRLVRIRTQSPACVPPLG